MTSPEHTLVGIHFAIACGLHRRWGWSSVLLAGIASNLPDWDGLPMLIDMQRFEAGHRVWGHNVVSIVLSSIVLIWTEVRYGWINRLSHWTISNLSSSELRGEVGIEGNTSNLATRRMYVQWTTGMIVAISVQCLHLPCDMVVSGGFGLNDWSVKPWWPFSQAEYVLPLIPWGDIGPTVIMMAGVILGAKRPGKLSKVSAVTLIVLIAYLLARGWSRGILS